MKKALFFLLALGLAAAVSSEDLTLEDALKQGLSTDPGLQSALWDYKSATWKSWDAQAKQLPTISTSFAATQLSPIPSISLFGFNISYPDQAYSFDVNVQYPVFVGFRIHEAIELAKLQVVSKDISADMVRRALIFEIRRAYWEAQRAGENVATLKTSLDLAKLYKQEIQDEVDQGLATSSDLLSGDLRVSQTEISLADAIAGQQQAFLVLSSMIGKPTMLGDLTDAPLFQLTTPLGSVLPDALNLPEDKLVAGALTLRPEIRAARLGVEAAEHSIKMAQADLYPSVILAGDFTDADPNTRYLVPPTSFTGSWTAGVVIKYDPSAAPGAYVRIQAASADADKARSDAKKLENSLRLDVQRTLLSYRLGEKSLELTRGMVAQAQENYRVAQLKFENGVFKKSEELDAQLNLVRAQFSVSNKEIDREIALADLMRAGVAEKN